MRLLWCWMILVSQPLVATSTEDRHLIDARQMYHAPLNDPDHEIFDLQEQQAFGTQTFLWQNITPDTSGVFRLQFDPTLYQQSPLFLLLKNQQDPQNKPVAVVSYQDNIFRFLGLRGSHFDLSTPVYHPAVRTYLGQNSQGEIETCFEEQMVEGDGNCALSCLGIGRTEAVRLLREQGRAHLHIRQRVSPDIRAHLAEKPHYIDQFPHLKTKFQQLIAQEDEQRIKRSRLQGDINDRLNRQGAARLTDTASFLSDPDVEASEKTDLQAAEQAYLAAEQATNDLLTDSRLYDAYIKEAYGTSSGWFSYSTHFGATMALDALCEIMGINLTIKRLTPEGILKTVHTHHTKAEGIEKILWHTSMARDPKTSYAPDRFLNHFSLLRPPPVDDQHALAHEMTRSSTDWITSGQPEGRTSFWPNCQIHVDGNVTLQDATFQGHAQVHGKKVTLKGKTFATDGLTLQAQTTCRLEEMLWSPQLRVKANYLDQQARVRCQKSYFEIERGETKPESFVQADQDIIVKGFEQFSQQGDLRAKRFVLIEGDQFDRQPDAYTFAGVLSLINVARYQDQGQTTAWQHQLKARRILFDQTSRILGHYLFAQAHSDQPLTPALLETAPGSQLSLGFAGHLQSQNCLSHQGRISLLSALSYSFPSWEYWLGTKPRNTSHTTPEFRQALRQLSQDMSGPREPLKAKVKDIVGIFLEAAGTLDQKGALVTPFTSTQVKAGKILFSGRHHSGLLAGNKTWIDADQADYQGTLRASQGIHFDIKEQLTLGGDIQAHLLQAITPEVTLTGRTHTGVLDLDTSTLKVLDKSSHTARQRMSLLAQDQFDNQGQLSSQGDIILKGPKTYHLGRLHADNCFHFAPHDLPPIYDLFNSSDPALTQNGGLNLVSGRPEVFDQPLDRPFHIGLKAPSIIIQQPLVSTADLYFESTQGSIQIQAPLSGRTLDVISSQTIENTAPIKLSQDGRFRSQDGFVNTKQILALRGQIDIEGTSIDNTGNQSKIIAQTLTLNATQGDLTNEGRLQGFQYVEGVAKGNIISRGLAHRPESTEGSGFFSSHGKENAEEAYFLPACIEGGQGIAYIDPKGQTRQLSLRLQAGGRIENYVSYFFAPFDIVMTGQEGISHRGDKIKYIAYHDEDEGFLGFSEEEVTVTKELVGEAEIISTQGRIASYSPNGGIYFKAAQEIGKEGDIIVVRDNIDYDALILETVKKVESSEWWGMSEDSEEEIHQDTVVAQLLNDGPGEHFSREGRIYGRAPVIRMPIYRIRSKAPAIFEGVKLHHHYEHKHRSCVPFFFSSKTLKGGSVRKALMQEDPLLQQYHAFRNSHHPTSNFASGVKLGVQAWNDFKNLAQAESTLIFLAERYGNVGLEFGKSKHTRDSTTTRPPIIDVDVADFGDMTEVRLMDGTILLAKDQVILPHHLILGKATDYSQERYKSSSGSVGINVFTKMPSLSYSQHQSRSDQETHRNAIIEIYGPEGVLDASQSQSLTLDGGRIKAPRAKGRIEQVRVISHQDQATSSHKGFGFEISGILATGPRGSANIARGRAHMRTVTDESGLEIQDPSDFSIDNLTITGPRLDPKLAAFANKVTFHPLTDDKSTWSFQGSVSNLDLRSPEKFFDSLGESIGQAARAYLAAELTHQMGGTGMLPSIAGTLAGLTHTNDGTQQDVNITGGIAFKDDKRHFDIPLLNINSRPTPTFPFRSHDPRYPQDLPNNQNSAIIAALQKESATEEEIKQILENPDLSWFIKKGQEFQPWPQDSRAESAKSEKIIQDKSESESESNSNSNSNSNTKTNRSTYIPEVTITPRYQTPLEYAVSLTEEAGLFLDAFAEKHPTLAKFAAISLKVGLGGPSQYLINEIIHQCAGNQIDNLKQAGVTYISNQLDIPERDVELTNSGISFGLSLILDKAKGVLKDARKVSQALKNRTDSFHKKGTNNIFYVKNTNRQSLDIHHRNFYNPHPTEKSSIELSNNVIKGSELKKVTEGGFGVTKHGVSRKVERSVKTSDIVDALKNPLKIKDAKIDTKGRLSQKYIGKNATVAINPKTKNIVSVNPTASKLSKRLSSK